MCSVANHYCRVSFTVILFTCALFFVVAERGFWHWLYTEFCVYQCVENELHEFEHTIFCCGIQVHCLQTLTVLVHVYIYPCTKCGVFPLLSYTSPIVL